MAHQSEGSENVIRFDFGLTPKKHKVPDDHIARVMAQSLDSRLMVNGMAATQDKFRRLRNSGSRRWRSRED